MAELLNISSVLTPDYLSQQLTKWFSKDVKYTKHEFNEGTGKGDSYLSDVFRLTFFGSVVADNTTVSVRVILKAFPANIGRRKTFRSHTFFRNEINFYEIILPKLLEFQSKKKVTEPFVSCPKVFASITNGEDDFLALEDLGLYGYGGAVRQEGIDYPHCEKIFEMFAKLHALSFAYKDQHPSEYKKFAEAVPEVYYSEQYLDWYKGFWKLLCKCSIDAIEKEYPNTIYEKKVKEFATIDTFYKMTKASDPAAKSAVIGHGDCWTPNFLFKYKEGTNIPTDSMMIDFQLTRSASPILDVAFFIYACTSQELRNEKYDDMLKYYHTALSTQIKELGSDPEKLYSWDVFMDEVKKLSYYGVGFSMESTPVIILEPEEAFEMDSITGTDAINIEEIWDIKPIKSKAGRQRLCTIFVHAVDRGYI